MILETAHLRIVPLDAAQLGLLLDGTPAFERKLGLEPSGMELDGHTRTAMASLHRLARETPGAYPWITNWQIILKSGNISVGSLCFMNVPDADGSVEVGYGIYSAFRNRGVMTEALRGVCDWALRQPGVRRVLAESEPENFASHRVLEKCGFRPVSATCWSCPRPEPEAGLHRAAGVSDGVLAKMRLEFFGKAGCLLNGHILFDAVANLDRSVADTLLFSRFDENRSRLDQLVEPVADWSKPLTIYASPQILAALSNRRRFRPYLLQTGTQFELGGLTFSVLAGESAFGFCIEGVAGKLLYMPGGGFPATFDGIRFDWIVLGNMVCRGDGPGFEPVQDGMVLERECRFPVTPSADA